jgi:hypothetical protein
MLQSHVIEFHGVFAGAAIRTARNFRFVAVHPNVVDLHHHEWATLPEVRAAVAALLRAGRRAA